MRFKDIYILKYTFQTLQPKHFPHQCENSSASSVNRVSVLKVIFECFNCTILCFVLRVLRYLRLLFVPKHLVNSKSLTTKQFEWKFNSTLQSQLPVDSKSFSIKQFKWRFDSTLQSQLHHCSTPTACLQHQEDVRQLESKLNTSRGTAFTPSFVSQNWGEFRISILFTNTRTSR